MDEFSSSMRIDEVLKHLNIEFDDFANLSDGSCIFQITNLEDEQEKIIENMGLKSLGYNLFYFENSEISLNTILPILTPYFISREKEKWEEIIDKLYRTQHLPANNEKINIFKPSISHIKIVSKWNGKITTTNSELGGFVTDIYKFFIEGFKKNLVEKECVNDFWKIVCALRHIYSHDTSSWRDKDRIKLAQRQQRFFQEHVGIEYPSTKLDYINSQFTILKFCDEFLENLE